MKKLVLTALAVVFMAGAAFAASGDSFINVKLGIVETAGSVDGSDNDGWSNSSDVKSRTSMAAEYLYALNDIFSFGGGLEYLFPREIKDWGAEISYLPIYATVKANPIPVAKEVFFKANLGYSVLFKIKNWDDDSDDKGGLYYAVGAGYEFPIGLAVDLTYGRYESSSSYDGYKDEFTYSKIGINVGYKLKI